MRSMILLTHLASDMTGQVLVRQAHNRVDDASAKLSIPYHHMSIPVFIPTFSILHNYPDTQTFLNAIWNAASLID